MIVSKSIYSPQSFLEAVTGNCYMINYDINVVDDIKQLLKSNGYGNLRCVPFIKAATMLEKFPKAVLVNVSNGTEEYYWFEVPENFSDN